MTPRNSPRGRKGPKSSHNKKCKARTKVGRGEVSLLCDPGSEQRQLTGRRERRSVKMINGMDNKNKKMMSPIVLLTRDNNSIFHHNCFGRFRWHRSPENNPSNFVLYVAIGSSSLTACMTLSHG